MLTPKKTLFLLFILLLNGVNASHLPDSICQPGTCGCHSTFIPAGIMQAHVHNKNEWMLSYRYMYMDMNGMISGTANTDKNTVFQKYLMAPDNMRMHMHMLMAMYGITDRLTVMAMLHYNSFSMNMSMFAVSTHHHNGAGTSASDRHQMKTSGLGDTRLYAMYALVKNDHHQLVLSAGANFPTGSIAQKGHASDMMYPDQRLPYNMQLGSGTIDVLPGLAYVFQHNRFTAGAQFTGTIRTHYNQFGYQQGNELVSNIWTGYRCWNFLGFSLRGEGIFAGPIQGYDPTLYPFNEPAANVYNSGGKRVNVYAGAHLQGQGKLQQHAIAIEYGLPVYQNLNGIQMPYKQLVNASWSLTF